MILLNSQESLSINTSSTSEIAWTLNYTLLTRVNSTPTGGDNVITAATDTELYKVIIPAARALVTGITIVNNGGTTNNITVNKIVADITLPITPTVPLNAGEYLQYTESQGWVRYDVAGQIMTIGEPGQGVPSGGTTGQVLAKIDGTDFNTQWVTLVAGGDVVGPASATNLAIPVYDGTTGKLIKNSVVLVQNTTGNISGLQKITIGVAASATGSIELLGTTSGTVTLKVADAAGTWTFTLPANDGSANQFLQTDGSGVTSWQTVLGVTDGDKGDITVSSTGTVWTIDNDAVTTVKIADSNVTLAKIANIADQTILGNNTGGAAAPVALTATQTKTVLSLNNVENTALSTWAGTSNITTLGTIATGVWNGTVIGSTYGGTGVNNAGRTLTIAANSGTISFTSSVTLTVANTASVSGTNTGDQTTAGTTNRITVTNGSTSPVIDIAATYVGQTSITTLGTITTGTWGTGAVIAGATMTLGSDATGDIYYRNAGGILTRLGVGSNGNVLTLAAGLPSWAAAGAGTVTTVSVVSANGFAGSVANASSTPAITLTTTITGIIKGNGTAISAAVSGTDYSAGTSALATGILKSTATTGALTIAVAGDFPTLNQNTTGSAATLTTARAIYGNNFDGSAALTQVIASTYGGTGNGFTKFTGPTTSEKTFTLPDASATLVTTTAVQTLSSKNIVTRIGTTASSATPTADADLHDQYNVTALSTNATFGAPTGTPSDGQVIIYRIKDNATPRTLAYNAIFRAIGITLPTTTTASKTTYIGTKYNAADVKWDVLATGTEA